MLNLRSIIVAATVAAGLAGAILPAYAGSRTTNQIAGVRVAVHHAPSLALSTCVHGLADGDRLVVSTIENRSASASQPFHVTLHDASSLLGQAEFDALASGATTTFARVIAGLAEHNDDSSRDNDRHATDVAATQCTPTDD